MNCPKCSAVMESIEFGGIQVDRCSSCHGIFFDRLEAARLKAMAGSEAIDIGDRSTGHPQSSTERIRCPRDTSPMLRMVDPQQSHIHFEACPVCQGMFFDAGEFADWKKETLLDVVRGWFARER